MLVGDIKMHIWSLVNRDSLFQTYPPTIRKAWQPFITAMPEVLQEADLLFEPVSALNIMRARNVFWRYCCANDCARKMALAAPAKELDPASDVELYRNMVYHQYKGRILSAIFRSETFQRQLTPPPGKEATELAEALFLFSRTVGLSEDAKKLVKTGNPTMGDLLAVQPTIIFRLA